MFFIKQQQNTTTMKLLHLQLTEDPRADTLHAGWSLSLIWLCHRLVQIDDWAEACASINIFHEVRLS